MVLVDELFLRIVLLLWVVLPLFVSIVRVVVVWLRHCGGKEERVFGGGSGQEQAKREQSKKETKEYYPQGPSRGSQNWSGRTAKIGVTNPVLTSAGSASPAAGRNRQKLYYPVVCKPFSLMRKFKGKLSFSSRDFIKSDFLNLYEEKCYIRRTTEAPSQLESLVQIQPIDSEKTHLVEVDHRS